MNTKFQDPNQIVPKPWYQVYTHKTEMKNTFA